MDSPSVQSFIKQIQEVEIEVEFLTDNKSRTKEEVVVIKDAGVNAQALSFVEMSLQEVTTLTLPSGNKVTVVRPEAWVFHKGLTFVRRINETKKYKDLYGIWFVLSQLGDVSLAVQKTLPKLTSKKPPSWSKTLKENIMGWMGTASPKDWQMLESQDVTGKLSKPGFEALMNVVLHSIH